jgi:hypothetical protein
MKIGMPVQTKECNCFAMRSAARHVTQFQDPFLPPVGLRATQFSILVRLKRMGPLTIAGLAHEMVTDRTTLEGQGPPDKGLRDPSSMM